jgi:nucleotide-binding universal stress UspA family protein
MIAMKRILLPTDFSDPSANAARYAQALAETFRAALIVMHVIEEPYLYGWVPPEGGALATPFLREEVEARAWERLRQVIPEADRAKCDADLVMRTGSPFVEICRYAREQQIDLIVMGTHGRGPLAHMLMGSVAERVVRKAPCPVLTVRHPEHEFVMP